LEQENRSKDGRWQGWCKGRGKREGRKPAWQRKKQVWKVREKGKENLLRVHTQNCTICH